MAVSMLMVLLFFRKVFLTCSIGHIVLIQNSSGFGGIRGLLGNISVDGVRETREGTVEHSTLVSLSMFLL